MAKKNQHKRRPVVTFGKLFSPGLPFGALLYRMAALVKTGTADKCKK
jgi:hypothetical protein